MKIDKVHIDDYDKAKIEVIGDNDIFIKNVTIIGAPYLMLIDPEDGEIVLIHHRTVRKLIERLTKHAEEHQL